MRADVRTLVLVLAATIAAPSARAQSLWPDTFLARVEALALVQTLNATLLGARSATLTLDRWCADHRLAPDPKIRARLVRDVQKTPTPEQRQRLKVGPDEPVNFRHVELACGDRVLSEADNWYVPSRLTPEMNHLLETTDTAFGRAVQDLKPFRQTFATAMHWKPLPDGWENVAPGPPDRPDQPLTIPPTLFEHRALLFTSDQLPFSEVDEVYRADVLAFGPPK